MESKNRSYTLKYKKKNQLKQEISLEPKLMIKEETDSTKDYLSDSQEEKTIEDNSEMHPVSTYQYYFETIITIILCFHCYFIYSYLNIIHLIFCFLLIYSKYETDYTFFVKKKKTLLVVLIIIDSAYLILKSIFFIIFSLENSASENLEIIYPYFIVGYIWENYYEYAMVFIIIVLSIVNLIIGDFDYNFWKNSYLLKTFQILQKESTSNKSNLNFGLFYISFGAALYPSIINLAILLIGLLFFISFLFKNNFRIIMKKYSSIIMIFFLPAYTIID
jgi:hypothetical protein